MRTNRLQKNKAKNVKKLTPQEQFRMAMNYRKPQDADIAIDILIKLTDSHPNLYHPPLALAYKLLHANDNKLAIKYFLIAHNRGSTRAKEWLQGDTIARTRKATLQQIAKHCTLQQFSNAFTEKKRNTTLQYLEWAILRTMQMTTTVNGSNNKYLINCYWLAYQNGPLETPYSAAHLLYPTDLGQTRGDDLIAYPWRELLGMYLTTESIETLDNQHIVDATLDWIRQTAPHGLNQARYGHDLQPAQDDIHSPDEGTFVEQKYRKWEEELEGKEE